MTDTFGSHVTVGWVTPAVAMQHLPGGKLVALAAGERTECPHERDPENA